MTDKSTVAATVRRVVPLALAAVLVLLAAAGGYAVGVSRANDVARRMDLYGAAQSRYTAFVFGRASDNAANEHALRAHVAALEARARQREMPSAYAFDKALALTRLSEMARRRGDADEAVRLSHEVDSVCPATGLHGCSANEILRTVRERDRAIWGETAE